jgi:hypothetical protein
MLSEPHGSDAEACGESLPPSFGVSGGVHSYTCAAPQTLRNKIHKFLQPELCERIDNLTLRMD